jgi:homoserine kinase
MTLPVSVRAPATTANVGPGFDCVAVALDLWNHLEVSEALSLEVEVEGEGADELPRDASHLGVRAFALLASPAGRRFRFSNRIPLARGLGSSAATIAVGLVAAALSEGLRLDAERLLARALELESHADNLAAALLGGVCLTWSSGGTQRAARIADRLPFVPVAVVPATRVSTEAARAALPAAVSHEDAAFTAGRAALLGAGLASGSPDLVAEALADRLHEPYRAATAPYLEAVRSQLPRGAVGATISGSGPTVVVWAREEAAAACVADLERRFAEARVLPLALSGAGAGP